MRNNITTPRNTDTPEMAHLRLLVAETGSVKAAASSIQYPATMGELTIRKILSGHRPNANLRGWLTRGAKRDARAYEAYLRDNDTGNPTK